MDTGTQRRWNAEDAAGFSADGGVPASAYGDSTSRSLARILVDPATEHCWDASDALPPFLRDAFTDAVLRCLADPGSLDEELRTVQAATGPAMRQARGGQDTVAFLPSVCARGG
ncbi:hypothetical protein [Streptomyces montanisoli]|uniref:Uncharacterized protein n=1 Tax=Streptomyces montanisoli TaxID=2798581 RepID=A0A940MBY9_9ACTN|nr:hypothetical protein [Streptomyces montanisoli]MBP0458479.1 hypothetical protein [Streptomyces montanisoli]